MKKIISVPHSPIFNIESILGNICKFLTPKDIATIGSISRYVRQRLTNHDGVETDKQILWQAILERSGLKLDADAKIESVFQLAHLEYIEEQKPLTILKRLGHTFEVNLGSPELPVKAYVCLVNENGLIRSLRAGNPKNLQSKLSYIFIKHSLFQTGSAPASPPVSDPVRTDYKVINGIPTELDFFQCRAVLKDLITLNPQQSAKIGFFNLEKGKVVAKALNERNVDTEYGVRWFWTAEKENYAVDYRKLPIITLANLTNISQSQFKFIFLHYQYGNSYPPEHHDNSSGLVFGCLAE